MRRITKVLVAIILLLTTAKITLAANYTPVNGGQTQLKKYLVIENDAEIPATTFSFTLSSGQAIEGTESTLKVTSGPNPEAVKIGDASGDADGLVAFTVGEEATSAYATEAGKTGKKAALKTIYLDFSNVTFEQPGVYRYLLTESASANSSIQNDAESVRTIDVYVEDSASSLLVKAYVPYNGTVTIAPSKTIPVDFDEDVFAASYPWEDTNGSGQIEQEEMDAQQEAYQAALEAAKAEALEDAKTKVPNGAEAGTKKDSYVNEVLSKDLTVAKTVTGTQGSHSQYFAIKISLTGLGAGTILHLDKTNMEVATHTNSATSHDIATMDEANSVDMDSTRAGAQLVANATGSVEATIYLHHGQSMTILNIPKGASWKVEEIDEATGYSKTYENDTGIMGDTDVTAKVTNDRDGIIPTGLATTIGLGVGLVAFALGYFMLRRKGYKQ